MTCSLFIRYSDSAQRAAGFARTPDISCLCSAAGDTFGSSRQEHIRAALGVSECPQLNQSKLINPARGSAASARQASQTWYLSERQCSVVSQPHQWLVRRPALAAPVATGDDTVCRTTEIMWLNPDNNPAPCVGEPGGAGGDRHRQPYPVQNGAGAAGQLRVLSGPVPDVRLRRRLLRRPGAASTVRLSVNSQIPGPGPGPRLRHPQAMSNTWTLAAGSPPVLDSPKDNPTLVLCCASHSRHVLSLAAGHSARRLLASCRSLPHQTDVCAPHIHVVHRCPGEALVYRDCRVTSSLIQAVRCLSCCRTGQVSQEMLDAVPKKQFAFIGAIEAASQVLGFIGAAQLPGASKCVSAARWTCEQRHARRLLSWHYRCCCRPGLARRRHPCACFGAQRL